MTQESPAQLIEKRQLYPEQIKIVEESEEAKMINKQLRESNRNELAQSNHKSHQPQVRAENHISFDKIKSNLTNDQVGVTKSAHGSGIPPGIVLGTEDTLVLTGSGG